MKHKLNPAAVALGRLARGHRKTMTPAALEQRTLARAARRCACQVPELVGTVSTPQMDKLKVRLPAAANFHAADDDEPPRVMSGPAINVEA